eukprot:c40828_g1_i1 orf=3-227(-)
MLVTHTHHCRRQYDSPLILFSSRDHGTKLHERNLVLKLSEEINRNSIIHILKVIIYLFLFFFFFFLFFIFLFFYP